MNYKQIGYDFGKALCAENIDPLYYLQNYILLAEVDFTFSQERWVSEGAQQAIREMPAEQLLSNVKLAVMNRLDMDDDQGATPYVESENDLAFEDGVISVVSPTLYALRDKTHEGRANFVNGQDVGRTIRNAWEQAVKANQ